MGTGDKLGNCWTELLSVPLFLAGTAGKLGSCRQVLFALALPFPPVSLGQGEAVSAVGVAEPGCCGPVTLSSVGVPFMPPEPGSGGAIPPKKEE